MEEGDRKASGGPVIATRSEAIQRFLSGLPRGWSSSQWRLIPPVRPRLPAFLAKGLTGRTWHWTREVLDQSPKINTEI